MVVVRLVQPPYGGGSYTNCSDMTQPGVAPDCELPAVSPPIRSIRTAKPGHYYLLNNYNPGYFGNGNNAYTDTNANNTVFTIPPSSVPSIGDTTDRRQRFVEVLRRSVEQLRAGPLSAQLRGSRREHRRVLQHLQPVPVRHLHHGQRRCPHGAHSGHWPISTPISSSERCRRFPSSSPAGWWTAIRRPRN